MYCMFYVSGKAWYILLCSDYNVLDTKHIYFVCTGSFSTAENLVIFFIILKHL